MRVRSSSRWPSSGEAAMTVSSESVKGSGDIGTSGCLLRREAGSPEGLNEANSVPERLVTPLDEAVGVAPWSWLLLRAGQAFVQLRLAGLQVLPVFCDDLLDLLDHLRVCLRHVCLLAGVAAEVVELRRVMLDGLARAVRGLSDEVGLPRPVSGGEQPRAAVV